ncbi:Srl2p [Saccharomyces eubayanus]|uniref:Srl2p n=1 Tax=Saccharomyces eubayanus TaxID=1080349 RepID=UPI0006C22938|nr:SRL2-like protein [Saccharomyces eubayanus]KOG97794.1 SRL2-like protein [Saccharomyces eubayanus]
MSNFKNFTLNSFEDYYGKTPEPSRMEEEKLEATNLNVSSLKKVHKGKKNTSKYDQKNIFRNSMTGVVQAAPLKPIKIIEQNIEFANPKSFDLLQSTHTICFSKKNGTADTKLNMEAQTSSDIDNDLLHVGAPTDLGGNSNDEAETRQLRKFRWSNNKDKCFCEKLTVIYWALLLNTTKRASKRRPILCHQVIAEFFNRVYKEKSRVPITSRYIRDNLVTWMAQGKELHEKGWINSAKTGDLQEQFNFATVKLYESAEDGRFIASKDKTSTEENAVNDSAVQPEEESADTTDEVGPVTTGKSMKEDRRELIRNQILALDLNDEDFFQNVMKTLSSIDEPELRQYVTIVLELVNMEIDDGKTVREKLRDVEMSINRLQVDITEIKEMLTALANR